MKKRLMAAIMSLCMLMLMMPMPALAADSSDGFSVKPYLLGPKADGMTIAWEAKEASSAVISLGTEEGSDDVIAAAAVSADPEAPVFNGIPMQFFSYQFTELKPETTYYYTVTLADGNEFGSSFTTLPADPEKIKILYVTDTHQFDTQKDFAAYVNSYAPQLILHTGDIPEGTGTQKDQFSYWLGEGSDDFIHSTPVVYAPGNHDYGEFYTEYFGKPQAKAYGASDASGANYSFDLGKVHIIMMDSNPWGLLEMNIATAGGTIGAELQNTIDSALAWLEADLQSPQAQNAAFRIVGMHHPYQDSFTKKYIPSILEKYHADLYLSGHAHAYAMNVSAEPAVGASTVYIQGRDARSASAGGDWATIEVDTTSGLLTFTNIGSSNPIANNTYVLSAEKQQLQFSDISIQPETILSNGSVKLSATVTNIGNGLAAAALPVYDNGTLRYIYPLAASETGAASVQLLNAGESKTFYGTLKLSELGKHTLQLADFFTDITVTHRDAEFDYSNLRIKLGNGSISDPESDILNVKVDIENIGNDSGAATAFLKINGEEINYKKYRINAGETITAEFQHQFRKAGTYSIEVGDGEHTVKKNVTIEGSIQGMPFVEDKSENGHIAYIHGTPELTKDDKGNTALVLNKDAAVGSMASGKDYIEIPDNGSYTVDDGVTGMVWAKWLHEPSNATFDHFPLLMKGPSISHGVNYLYRMAIRKTGLLTYGIGFDNENGEYFWNDNTDAGAKTNEWVMYSGAFDRKNGGVSFENGVKSGQIDPPAYQADIVNWEGSPLLVGVSHFYTLLNKHNRGSYNSTLSAEVSQIRFYHTRVDEEETKYLTENPSAKGNDASAERLAVWMDFNKIHDVGTHTTEWIPCGLPETLHYVTEIAGKSQIEAIVQTSDDISSEKPSIKESRYITLSNGTDSLDLTDMAQAKYIRVVSVFSSDLNEAESTVPVLREYNLLTSESDKVWNTAASFAAGTFHNAVAHQSEDFYAVGVSEFDDYSGTPAEPDCPSSIFTDVDTNEWYHHDIDYVVTHKLMVGTSATTFEPQIKLTRAMIVQMLYNHAGKPEVSSGTPFTDLTDEWYQDAIAWGYENKIIYGMTETTFAPSEPLTREQLATILYRLDQKESGSYEVPEVSLDDFMDTQLISDYAKDGIQWAVYHGIFKGSLINGKLYLNPQMAATRAESAATAHRFLVSRESNPET